MRRRIGHIPKTVNFRVQKAKKGSWIENCPTSLLQRVNGHWRLIKRFDKYDDALTAPEEKLGYGE